MHKIRNTGTGNGMRATRGMGECYIKGNVTKHSGECSQAFWGMSTNIPDNILKYSGECQQRFRGMLSNIPGNILKHSKECRQTFQGMSVNIPGNQTNFNKFQHLIRGINENGGVYFFI